MSGLPRSVTITITDKRRHLIARIQRASRLRIPTSRLLHLAADRALTAFAETPDEAIHALFPEIEPTALDESL